MLSFLLPTAVTLSPRRTPQLDAVFCGAALAKHAVQLRRLRLHLQLRTHRRHRRPPLHLYRHLARQPHPVR